MFSDTKHFVNPKFCTTFSIDQTDAVESMKRVSRVFVSFVMFSTKVV